MVVHTRSSSSAHAVHTHVIPSCTYGDDSRIPIVHKQNHRILLSCRSRVCDDDAGTGAYPFRKHHFNRKISVPSPTVLVPYGTRSLSQYRSTVQRASSTGTYYSFCTYGTCVSTGIGSPETQHTPPQPSCILISSYLSVLLPSRCDGMRCFF